MPRTLTADALASLLGLETDRVWLHPLDLIADEWAAPVRLVDNGEDVLFDGLTYTAFPYRATIPSDSGDRLPTVQVRLCNVDRRLVEPLRNLRGRAWGRLWIGMIEEPAASPPVFVAEAGPWDFTLRNVQMDALVVTVTFAYQDLLNASFPAHHFDPRLYPGVAGTTNKFGPGYAQPGVPAAPTYPARPSDPDRP